MRRTPKRFRAPRTCSKPFITNHHAKFGGAHADFTRRRGGQKRRVFIPAALRAAQKRRYLSYTDGDFEVLCHIRTTRCTDGDEPQKLKILLKFDQMSEYINAPQRRAPRGIFAKFAEFVPRFRMR